MMARSSRQKFKPLYLAKILLERTDENNILTAQELCDALSVYDVPSSRQSIYDDIEALREFGLDVMLKQGKGGGYYVAKRDFDLSELILLVDAAQSSRLVTGKKCRELIDKLAKLTSREQAKHLNRQVYVNGRAITLNDKGLNNVAPIHEALNAGKKISFKYFEYDVQKKRKYRKNSASYIRTPVAMCWNDDNYYLITYNPKYADRYANFRVDRMSGITVLDEEADKLDEEFSIENYVERSFSMFSGEIVIARLAFDNSLVSAALDQFGNDVSLRDIGGGRFEVKAEVSNSPVFLSWIFQFGDKAEILEPPELREAMRELISTVSTAYGE
jgi:predicted DNA-binding transcriptional regulator YafY